MIYLTGDTHLREIQPRFNFDNFAIGRELTKEDYVIVCGDFGVWSGDTNKEELYSLLNNWFCYIEDKSLW